jgi:hypothetical protein
MMPGIAISCHSDNRDDLSLSHSSVTDSRVTAKVVMGRQEMCGSEGLFVVSAFAWTCLSF